jgi:hypothetical protein
MNCRSISVAFLASVLLVILGAEQSSGAPERKPYSPPEPRELLRILADYSPDPCGPPYGTEEDWHTFGDESSIFESAADLVTQGLDTTSVGPGSATDRATLTMKRLEKMSAEVNAAWPEERRFHFEILDLSTALVVKMTLRTQARFFVFGQTANHSRQSSQLWKRVGEDDVFFERKAPRLDLDLYPLHRGPSGNARFLSKFTVSGCAGSIGVVYEASEWNPKNSTDIDRIIKQEGTFGLDDKVPGFEQIGGLKTEGSLITLPYCWFSGIDTWDNPSMCAVDTYDISGDKVRFRSRDYNRPDLLPIARIIEYAQKRDYSAVLGYCASSRIAHRLIRDFPPIYFAEDVRMTPTGKERERVELGLDHFDVENHGGRWVVVDFSAE